MEQNLSFFNYSLKKLLSSEPSTFNRAKIKILFSVLMFSLVKGLIVVAVAGYYNQPFQLGRAIFLLAFYTVLLKLLLANKSNIKIIAHIMVVLGLMIIWSIVYVSAQTVNIITLQFVFMLIVSSFYLLGTRYGVIYSFLSAVPIILYMLSGEDLVIFDIAPDVLASPGLEILVILNFVTIIVSHYLFHQGFVENVAEKEALNAQLQVAVKEANLGAQSKSDFLSTMSHEIRTPLNSVLGMTNLFLNDPNSCEKKENLKILEFSALSLHSLINDILDFNKLDSDKVQLEAVSVNLYDLIKDVCSALNFSAKDKGIDLLADIDETLRNQKFITDPTRLTQILYNLGGNAIKFTTKGSVSVRLKVLEKDESHYTIMFSVIDTGIGINQDKQEFVFEAFNQASSSISRNYGGTGLGLSIVKQLLKLFNSDVKLTSKAGSGSDFSFKIDFAIDKEVNVIEDKAIEINYDLNHLKILVAEDNLMNRILLKKIFSKWNADLAFVENGQEAIEKASAEMFDVILMDLYMPVVDGYNAAMAIRNLPDPNKSNVYIIAFTASVSDNLYSDIKAAGMNDYIYKPFNTKDLYHKLKDIKLKSHQASQL